MSELSYSNSKSRTALGNLLEYLLSVNTTDPVRLRRGRLVSLVLVLVLTVTGVLLVANLLSAFILDAKGIAPSLRLLFLVVVFGATYSLNRRAASPVAGLMLAMTILLVDLVWLAASDLLGPTVIMLTVPVVIAGLLGPPVSAFLLATLTAIVYTWLVVNAGTPPQAILFGDESNVVVVYINLYLLAGLAWLFSRMAGRAIQETHDYAHSLLLNQRELEAQLERQTLSMRATTSVARAVAGTRHLDVLVRDVVKLVRDYFGFEQVQLFLIDASRQYAVLQAATGRTGRELLARDYKLPMGSVSIVSQVAERGESIVADSSHIDALLRRVEGATDMRSEMAVPFMVGERVVGVLDVQSSEEHAFDNANIPVLEALAEQLAMAIENARIYEEAQRNITELNTLSRMTTYRGWRDYLASRSDNQRVFRYGEGDRTWPLRQEAIVQQVVDVSMPVVVQTHEDGTPGYLAVPVMLRSEVIGVVGVEVTDNRQWSQEDVSIMHSIAERTALAVENARLFEQADRTARREQLINLITARLQRAPTLQMLLEGAASELSQVMGTDQVFAEFVLHDTALQDGAGSRRASGKDGRSGLMLSRNGGDNQPRKNGLNGGSGRNGQIPGGENGRGISDE